MRKEGLNVPAQPTVPQMPEKAESFQPDMKRCFSTIVDNDEAIEAMNTLKRAGYHIVCTNKSDKAFMVMSKLHEPKALLDLADRVQDLLIEVGQSDTVRFKIGDTIRYSPSEVAEIIRQSDLK